MKIKFNKIFIMFLFFMISNNQYYKNDLLIIYYSPTISSFFCYSPNTK